VKLILYGGGSELENRALNIATLKLFSRDKLHRSGPRITYIPASSYDSEVDFWDFAREFEHLGVRRLMHFPIDVPFDKVIKKAVFESDIIHLGGGNTFYFLKAIRKSAIINDLVQFLRRGGILTGLSAGAIVMTPTIETAGYPTFDCDKNDVALTNLRALGLVNFDFFPHYKHSKRYQDAFIKFTSKRSYPLYACPDNSGIIVDGKNLTFHGKAWCFYRGKVHQINKTYELVSS
jgi:dipeptidase E